MASTVQEKQPFNLYNSNRPDVLRLKRDIPLRNLPAIRSCITVAWLEDAQRSLTIESNSRMHTFLQNDHYSVIFYSNIRKCIKYLKRTRSREYVIAVIISYPIEVIHQMIYRLRQYRIVQTIYIVTSGCNITDCFSSTRDNISIFENQNSMLDRLQSLLSDVQKVNLEGGLFTTFNRKERALKDMREELGKFVSDHVLKMSITRMPYDAPDAKQEMLAECRSYYRNDPIQLASIDEFERTYKPNDAIRWYTKPGFLFYLLNKSLRSGDILAFYTFRYFIKDLCIGLKEASAVQSKSFFRLYRGAKLHREEVASLSVGCVMAASSFFSCSRDRRVAEMFISIDSSTGESSNRGQNESLQYVLFQIDVDLKKAPDTIVADVSAQSELPGEDEMIFTLGSIFIIDQIVYEPKKSIWLICMSSFYDLSWNKYKHEKYMRQKLRYVSSSIWFCNALVSIESNYTYSLDYCHLLLRSLPFDHVDRPDIYFSLGRIYRFLEKYEKALTCFQSARLLLRRLLPERIFSYCRALSGAGLIYAELGDIPRAIRSSEEAVNLQSKHLPDNHTEIPFHLNRLAHAYFKAKRFESALAVLGKADDFFEKRMLVQYQGHVQTLHAMGLVHHALGDVGKAYSCFKKALWKCESLLSKDHPNAASACYQLSLIHQKRGKIEIALDYAKRSLRIRLNKLPYYHSELKQSIELVERLQDDSLRDRSLS